MYKPIRRYFYSKEYAEDYGCHVINYNGDEIPYTERSSESRCANSKFDDIVEVFRCYEDEERELDICYNKYKGIWPPESKDIFDENENPDKMPEANTRWLNKEKYPC